MKFPYKKLPLETPDPFFGGSSVRPIIHIEVEHGKEIVRYEVLVDSGADFNIFDAGIGEYLGINVRSGHAIAFGGIQDREGATAYLHDVTLRVGGHRFPTTVGFTSDLAAWGMGIVGQKGFFDLFIVKFDRVKEEVELKARRFD